MSKNTERADFKATLPMGVDALRERLELSSTDLGRMFPFSGARMIDRGAEEVIVRDFSKKLDNLTYPEADPQED